jgi:hypothetical protein
VTDFDSPDMAALVADLGKIPGRMVKDQVAVVTKGAQNVKKDWANRWSGLSHAPHIHRAISYDVNTRPGEVSAEIGPDKDKMQGPLGNVIEYGTSNNAPIPGGGPALKAEEPRLVKAVGDMLEDIL